MVQNNLLPLLRIRRGYGRRTKSFRGASGRSEYKHAYSQYGSFAVWRHKSIGAYDLRRYDPRSFRCSRDNAVQSDGAKNGSAGRRLEGDAGGLCCHAHVAVKSLGRIFRSHGRPTCYPGDRCRVGELCAASRTRGATSKLRWFQVGPPDLLGLVCITQTGRSISVGAELRQHALSRLLVLGMGESRN